MGRAGGGGSGACSWGVRWNSEFAELRRRQLGAFSRAQANAFGVSDRSLTAHCGASRIQRVYRGAYVDFTGPVPWQTRVVAAWLAYGPDAALAGETALRQYGVDGNWDDVIRLEVPHERRLRPEAGVLLSRSRDFTRRVVAAREPPIVRMEVAVLTVAARRPRLDSALALVLDCCRQRRTTPYRLLMELDAMPRLPRRKLLREVLRDASSGVESFLELTYLRKVERAHGLPPARRQVRVAGRSGTIYRDNDYEYDLVVELDGRVGHEDVGSQWRDMGRDNAALLDGKVTLRFGYQLVADRCSAAAQVAAVLRSHGWSGHPTPCAPACAVSVGLGSAVHLK